MVELTANWLIQTKPRIKRVGLLATEATIRYAHTHRIHIKDKVDLDILTPHT